MKVLVLSHISELLGGAERSMLDVFDYLAKHHGVEPEFILREPVKSLAGELKKRGWKYHSVRYTFWSDSNPPKNPEAIYINSVQNAKAISQIEGIIKKVKPDLVATNTVVCPWAAIASYNQKVPHIWFVREYGDLDHGRIYEIGREKTLEDVGNLSNLVVTISIALEKHLAKYIDNKKLAVLYNPFKLEEITKRAQAKTTNPYKYKGSLRLMMTSNLAPSKGQLEAVQAVGKLVQEGKNVELCLLGRGDRDFTDKLHLTARELNISDRIHFVGHQANSLAYVSLADVGVMSSRREGFGRSTFEFLVLGKPVVGTKSGATPEIVIEGNNGFLFKPGDVNGLTSAIRRYAKDRKLLTVHGKAGYIHAKEMMSGENSIDRLYRKIEVAMTKPLDYSHPINYSQHLEKRLKIGRGTRARIKRATLKHLTKESLKEKLKVGYRKARSLKARATGR